MTARRQARGSAQTTEPGANYNDSRQGSLLTFPPSHRRRRKAGPGCTQRRTGLDDKDRTRISNALLKQIGAFKIYTKSTKNTICPIIIHNWLTAKNECNPNSQQVHGTRSRFVESPPLAYTLALCGWLALGFAALLLSGNVLIRYARPLIVRIAVPVAPLLSRDASNISPASRYPKFRSDRLQTLRARLQEKSRCTQSFVPAANSIA